MIEDLIELKKYYKQALQEVPADSFYCGSINHKFRHSIQVLQAGEEIMEKSPELHNISADCKTWAKRALLFHDIGRFQEAVCIYKDSLKNIRVAAGSDKYDHGLIGYNILKGIPQYNNLKLLLAIRYHGKMMEQVRISELWHEAEKSEEEKEIKQILYIVRDADKLANLRAIKASGHLKEDSFYKQLSEQAQKAPISSQVMQQFADHQVVYFPTIQSYNDRIMMVLSWLFDFNFIYTRTLFLSAGYADYLLNELVANGVPENIVCELKSAIKNFSTSVNYAKQP